MNFPLTGKDRMISIQFSFPNDDAVPIGLRSMKSEDEATAKKRKQLKNTQNGTDLFGGKYPEKADLSDLPVSIVHNGYILVNATYQSRRDQHDIRKTYHMVRFMFVRKEFEDLTDERLQKFLNYRGLMLAELQGICSLAFWRVRMFRNQYHKNGAPTNEHAISINLEARSPLFERSNARLAALPAETSEHEIFLSGSCIKVNRLW